MAFIENRLKFSCESRSIWPHFRVNEVKWVVGLVKPQALQVRHCIIQAKWICHVSTTLKLLLSFRFWVWLMKSWNYCRVPRENIVRDAVWPSRFVGARGNRARVCHWMLASGAPGLVRGWPHRLGLLRENKPSGPSWRRMSIRCIH